MQALAQWWREWAALSAGQAWGLAPQGLAWDLVGLHRHSATLAKVHTSQTLPIPVGRDPVDLSWLSQPLRHNGRSRGGVRHRLNLALPAAYLKQGVVVLPADLLAENWPFEVQLEAARVLQVAHDAVNFDFEPDPATPDQVRRIHWMGCTQTHMAEFKSFTRAAGWRLAVVESERQAAERGARALVGGIASLLTQAPQDWQFLLPATRSGAYGPPAIDSEVALADALEQVLNTPTGARLVASGSALMAWR